MDMTIFDAETFLYNMEEDLLRGGWTVRRPHEISLSGRRYTEWTSPHGTSIIGTASAYASMLCDKEYEQPQNEKQNSN